MALWGGSRGLRRRARGLWSRWPTLRSQLVPGPRAWAGARRGVLLVAIGLFVASVWRFASEGRGTLAPWDPPRAFVVEGPYRFVRNPMISGVMFVLLGEALILLSLPHGVWAVAFALANVVYIPLVEEPQLARRFGDPYLEYRRHVRRFVPRMRPWCPDRPGDRGTA